MAGGLLGGENRGCRERLTAKERQDLALEWRLLEERRMGVRFRMIASEVKLLGSFGY